MRGLLGGNERAIRGKMRGLLEGNERGIRRK